MSIPGNDQTDWLDRWNNNNIGFHLNDINPNLLEYWPTLSAQPGDHVFVPLCGKSLDMLWLQQQNLQVSGAELSPVAVEAFFQEHQIPVQIEELVRHKRWHSNKLDIMLGDFFTLPADFFNARYIYDRAALIALPPELQSQYVEQQIKVTPHVEQMLLSTLSYDTSKMQGPPFSTHKDQVQKLFQNYFNIELLSEKEMPTSKRFQKRGLSSMTDYVFRLERIA